MSRPTQVKAHALPVSVGMGGSNVSVASLRYVAGHYAGSANEPTQVVRMASTHRLCNTQPSYDVRIEAAYAHR